MENNNQSSVKTKNITLGSIISWILGVASLVSGVAYISSKPLVGILYLLIAAIILPPLSKMVQTKLHFALSRGVKIVLVLVLLVIIGISIGASGTDVLNSFATTPAQSTTQQPAIKVTAAKLAADYKANEVSADAKYKNNTVEVSGLVSTIGKDILDTPYIALSDGEQYSITSVQCMFSKNDEAQLATVSKGDRITLRGEVSGKLGNVLITGCSIMK